MVVQVGGRYLFTYTWHTVQERGFFFAMPWKQNDLRLNETGVVRGARPGQAMRIKGVRNEEDYTRPPDYLKESELIERMDRQGIGTDASIPQHIQNILDRRYCQVCGPGDDGWPGKPIPTEEQLWKMRQRNPNERIELPKSRHMVPSGLGLALIGAYMTLDRELCEPQVRAFMESQVSKIADGSESQADVVRANLDLFHKKFLDFRGRMSEVERYFQPKATGFRDLGGGDGWDSGGWAPQDKGGRGGGWGGGSGW